MNRSNLLGLLLVTGMVTLPVSEAWARGRSGAVRTPRGTGSYQGTSSGSRQPGSWQRNYQGTRTGAQGNTSQVERASNFNRTGRNTYEKNAQQTITGPNGQTRTSQAQGAGTVTRTENGYQKSYEGTITTDKGKTVDVDRTAEVTKNGDGTRTKETTATYTNQQGQSKIVDRNATGARDQDGTTSVDRDVTVSNGQGEVLGTGQSSTTHSPGQGSQTSGSYTNSQGNSWSQQGQAKWQWVDGKWVRVYSGESNPTP